MIESPSLDRAYEPTPEQLRHELSFSASSAGSLGEIYVPANLLDAVENSFGSIKTIENYLLFWQFIDAWPYADDEDEDWRVISDSCFGEVISSQNIRGQIRNWLEKQGFIKLRKFRLDNGVLVNHFIPGVEPLKYQPICGGPLIPYQLISKDYWGGLDSFTAPDPLCLATRANLSLLTKKNGEKPDYESEKAGKIKKNRDVHSLYKLGANAGNITRGQRVSRLYSPWVTASKEVRKCFLLDGCGISSLDLKAAQPTLIAQMAGDQKMLEDCKSDALYLGIAEMLGVERNDAKQPFMAYAYGKNRKDGRGNLAAFKVQEWMRERYRNAASFMAQEKTVRDYSELSCRLQDVEAAIFVDGIYAELTDKGLPALTVHDAIYFRDKDFGTVNEVAHKHLDQFIPNREYKLDDEIVSRAPLL